MSQIRLSKKAPLVPSSLRSAIQKRADARFFMLRDIEEDGRHLFFSLSDASLRDIESHQR
jgi:hypothetical protein